MARTSLPPGFRFHPTDVELIMYYLKRKAMGKKFQFEAIAELNIYKFGPWDLPDKSLLKSKDLEWYFFCPRERKYASGIRTNRSTECGYWKTTGKDRSVIYNQRTVGMIKTLVFHKGHAPKGERTDWVMHEYRIEDTNLVDVVQDYMLCKVFHKSGPGPKNGAQYGAPFNEEEWSNDVEEICSEPSPVDDQALNHVLPSNMKNSAAVSLTVAGNSCSHSISKPGPSTAGHSNFDMSYDMPDLLEEDIGALLSDMLTEDGTILPIENSVAEKFNIANNDNSIEALPCLDGDENQIFNDLGDLNNWAELIDNGFNLSSNQDVGYTDNPMVLGDDGLSFLELDDLDIPLPYRNLGGSCCEGEQETKPLSRLQLSLESISAQPASAAELPAHLIRAEKLNDSISYYVSSTHSKAEVTLKVGECTKDALSLSLGESAYLYVGLLGQNAHRRLEEKSGLLLARIDLWLLFCDDNFYNMDYYTRNCAILC